MTIPQRFDDGMNVQAPILVVDDDPELRRLISRFLSEHGYPVSAAGNVAEMRRQIERQKPDLIVLDVMMPGEDGLSACRTLASEGGPAIIILSALSSDTDRIIGLEVGADDYLPKPCNSRELLARIRAVLRRRQAAGAPAGSQYCFDGWQLDPLRRTLLAPDGVDVHLSDGEFSLLRAFVESPQQVLSRNQLLDRARGQGYVDIYDRAVDTQLSRLRRKLDQRGGNGLIRTVRNEGYMLLPAVSRA